ncbi:hypothetical protein A3D78_04430 [Candidatus Gottesmanbacteria bacterium RIFCSPHIGHO2_02_FULL_39_14]|uniref:Uncharacterized protein n=2 Tax=Candidatus Gottesmaniibacteriota TaxID=1752720 RepID=A0A1F6A351_9BACT|nr:MAG: hypothetical protein A3D78_04430 [Candidatus Gottesmanbacteria bacterium RIFCSPHIGHO2_02_FULL_39_14]OGG30851.1 MAG: hypothetical protein A3I51_01460 [Candidatus Gottesmanbacteria bacterium RIFCSPLOWO2_02_FULL_38_8]
MIDKLSSPSSLDELFWEGIDIDAANNAVDEFNAQLPKTKKKSGPIEFEELEIPAFVPEKADTVTFYIHALPIHPDLIEAEYYAPEFPKNLINKNVLFYLLFHSKDILDQLPNLKMVTDYFWSRFPGYIAYQGEIDRNIPASIKGEQIRSEYRRIRTDTSEIYNRLGKIDGLILQDRTDDGVREMVMRLSASAEEGEEWLRIAGTTLFSLVLNSSEIDRFFKDPEVKNREYLAWKKISSDQLKVIVATNRLLRTIDAKNPSDMLTPEELKSLTDFIPYIGYLFDESDEREIMEATGLLTNLFTGQNIDKRSEIAAILFQKLTAARNKYCQQGRLRSQIPGAENEVVPLSPEDVLYQKILNLIKQYPQKIGLLKSADYDLWRIGNTVEFINEILVIELPGSSPGLKPVIDRMAALSKEELSKFKPKEYVEDPEIVQLEIAFSNPPGSISNFIGSIPTSQAWAVFAEANKEK